MIICFLVCISIGLKAQLNIPKDTIWKTVETITVDVQAFDFMKLGTVTNDSVVYTTTDYPHFVTVEQVDNAWDMVSYKNDTIINGFLYQPLNTKLFKIMASGRIILSQQVIKKQQVIKEKPRGFQFWFYLQKAKELNVTPSQWINYPEVDTLINWDIYFQNETVNDTIL